MNIVDVHVLAVKRSFAFHNEDDDPPAAGRIDDIQKQ